MTPVARGDLRPAAKAREAAAEERDACATLARTARRVQCLGLGLGLGLVLGLGLGLGFGIGLDGYNASAQRASKRSSQCAVSSASSAREKAEGCS